MKLKWPSCRKFALEANSEVLLVIAHPDDEVMFFSPFLLQIADQVVKEGLASSSVSILCLSNGNDEGMGSVRAKELVKCAGLFKINPGNIHVVDHSELQDGMSTTWPTKIVSDIVLDCINRNQPKLVVTFDDYGVSGHPNHIATYFGVKDALLRKKQQEKGVSRMDSAEILGLRLSSVPLYRKFLGIFDLLIAYWLSDYLITKFCISIALKGMYIHRSQNRWYRQLFVLLSTFSVINSFTPII